MNSEELHSRTKKFTIDVIRYSRTLPVSEESRIIKRQLIRSASSVGANYRASCRARSKAEFIAKITIVLEEADESLFWLEVIEETGIDKSDNLHQLNKEALELVKIFSRTRKTAKGN